MIATHRPATLADAAQLLELRRKAIIVLAPQGMPAAKVAAWAADLTLPGMERKIGEMEIWVAEIGKRLVGWGAIRGDRLEGLYTLPEFARRGIGTELLGKLEGLMRGRGIRTMTAEASTNAEGFYLRRGYQTVGPRVGAAQPIAKQLA